jgi:hypothetical protein
VLGSKSHSCPERESASGRNDPGGKQTWRPEHKEMAAAPKVPVQKSLYGFSPNCQPRNRCGKAEAQWEETGTGTTERAGVRVQASKERFASDNVGKVPKTSSGWSKLQRLPRERKATAGQRLKQWPRTGLGKSDRPGSSGGSEKHSYGRTRHPLHNRKSGNGNSLPKVLVRSVSIPLTKACFNSWVRKRLGNR